MPEPVGEIEQEDYPDAEGREVLRQNTLAQRSGEIDAADELGRVRLLLDGACSVAARYREGWTDHEVVDGEGLWSRPCGFAPEDEEWMTGEEVAFLSYLEAMLSGRRSRQSGRTEGER
jgi:hypothetical protein